MICGITYCYLLFEKALDELRADARISLSTLRTYSPNVENAGLQTTLETLQHQLIAASAFSYLTLIQTFQLYVKMMFLGGHNRIPGLRLTCQSAEGGD